MTGARPATAEPSAVGTFAAGWTAAFGEDCQAAARHQGLAPALALLCTATLPGRLPCGPGGHAVVPAAVLDGAGEASLAEGVRALGPGAVRTARSVELPGGKVAMTALEPAAAGPVRAPEAEGAHGREAFALGLVWVRLGLSEALRTACMGHLGGRRSGDTYLLHQQLVKGTLAEAVTEHLEARAVLDGAGPGDLEPAMLARLHARLTEADREQVRLLGGSGYLTDSPGMTAYVSELLAEVYAPEDRP